MLRLKFGTAQYEAAVTSWRRARTRHTHGAVSMFVHLEGGGYSYSIRLP